MATNEWIRSFFMVPRMDSDELNGITVDAENKNLKINYYTWTRLTSNVLK